MILEHDSTQYRIGEQVADTPAYRAYLCEEVETRRQVMLQIASAAEHNGGLQRAAYILRELRRTSDLFEAEHAKRGGKKPLSYERLFPEVVDSFMPAGQGSRQANILAFTEIDDLKQLVPLSFLKDRDHVRVDLKSSAWVMGRLLKLLGLTHGERYAVTLLGGNNILLEPTTHYAVIFDWSQALTYPLGEIPKAVRRQEIAQAAQSVYTAIGGNPLTGEYPHPVDDTDRRYVELLWGLTFSRQGNAEEVHSQFYELVEELWGREFHPFKTLPL